MKTSAAYRIGHTIRHMILAVVQRARTISARIAFSLREAPETFSVPETFSLFDPRRGVVGIYPTPEEAQEAKRLLTITGRQRAIVYDADGHCMCR